MLDREGTELMPEAVVASPLPETAGMKVARRNEPVALLPPPVLESEATAQINALFDQAQQFAARARAGNTLRAYRSDWRDFEAWCRGRNFSACPAASETVVLYLTALSRTHKVSTLTRRMSAISQAHQTAGLASPSEESSVRLVMAGIRRSFGTAPTAKRPVLVAGLQAMVNAIPDNRIGLRDKAILLIGFSGAFRRSELVALEFIRRFLLHIWGHSSIGQKLHAKD